MEVFSSNRLKVVLLMTTCLLALAGVFPSSVQAQGVTNQNELYAKQSLIQGLTFLRTGFPDKAAGVFENALNVFPNDSVLLSAMAEAQQALGDPELAFFYIEKALQRSPDNPDVLQQALELAIASNQIGTALAHSARLIQLKPNHPTPVLQRLRLLSSVGQILVARDLAARSVNDFLANELLLRAFLQAFVAAGDLSSAAQGAQKLSDLTGSIEDQFRLATLLIQSGDTEGALSQLAELIELDPFHDPTRQVLSSLHETYPSSRRIALEALPDPRPPDESDTSLLQTLLQRLEANPTDADTAKEIGQLYLDSENYERAIQLAEAQIKADPRQLNMWGVGIQAHLKLGNETEALTLGEDASILFPGYAPLMLEYARALAAAGRYQEAIKVASQARDGSDNAPDVNEQLTQLLNQLEQYQ